MIEWYVMVVCQIDTKHISVQDLKQARISKITYLRLMPIGNVDWSSYPKCLNVRKTYTLVQRNLQSNDTHLHCALHTALDDSYKCRMGIGKLDEVNEKSLLDYKFPAVDLNKLLVKRTASTFFSRVAGDSLQEAGVNRGDVVIVDKSLLLRHNDIAVCFFNNSFTLKFVRRDNNVVWLIPANPDFKPINVVDEDDFRVWGIVTFIIKTRRKKNDFFG